MKYSTNIYNPEEGLDVIFLAVKKINIERFLYALQYKNFDERQIEKMAKGVAISRERLDEEHKRLVEFALMFNKQFATMNNKCFSSAIALLKKLRSGFGETKKIVKRFWAQ